MSTQDMTEIAKMEIRKALSKHFIGFEYDDGRPDNLHLEDATEDVLKGIARLLQQRSASRNKLGAAFMTESASMRTGKDGLPGIAPRTL